MYRNNIPIQGAIQWLLGRVAVIYIILFVFCLTCLDLKMLDARIKIRHLNDAIPDFTGMINFSEGQIKGTGFDWGPYKKYFELILHYMPDDVTTKQLLGYVDFYAGQEQKAIALYKDSSVVNGQGIFWSNYNLGVLYYKNGMWPQAAGYLLKAISSNPQLNTLLMQGSTAYRQISSYPNFKYSLRDEINDAQSKTYLLLVSSLFNMRQYDKVILISNLAIANQSLSYKDAFYFYAGLSYFEGGQAEKAFVLFQESLKIEKNNPDIYYYMANIFQKAGQLEQARDFLKISYALHQKHDPRFPYEASVKPRFF